MMPRHERMTIAELVALPVHHYAEMFPLLPTTQAESLANDVRQNGLTTPLDVYRDDDGNQWLLDGRNRLRALVQVSTDMSDEVPCEIRTPLDFESETIEQFIGRRNMQRRHLSKSQLAIQSAQLLRVGRKVTNA